MVRSDQDHRLEDAASHRNNLDGRDIMAANRTPIDQGTTWIGGAGAACLSRGEPMMVVRARAPRNGELGNRVKPRLDGACCYGFR